jgi:branched-chain amino acid transport system ATP-binding protein
MTETAQVQSQGEVVLEARGVSAGYHGYPVVYDLELQVRAGEVVALLGPNGAGKSTTLLTLGGELSPLSGEVWLNGTATKAPTYKRAKRGLSLVTEDRSIFPDLTLLENLRVGRCDVGAALAIFPELRPLLKRRVGLMSGGEQQMLTVARAIARRPKVLLIDELSLGLAPLVVSRLLEVVCDASQNGVGVLLVEQHVGLVLEFADRVAVMARGRIVLSGSPSDVEGGLEGAYLSSASELSRTSPATEQ